ncbi:hypothetical protein Hamer_G026354 [Homarus americanus]|uniref:Uncharacterized protein n=1 Tax=Homarus americanus TaxID=6706 RepID=A0A8J5JCR8_HOMAM|nr:hypothetical protein Hamer_G026354 [Homarus americanus]
MCIGPPNRLKEDEDPAIIEPMRKKKNVRMRGEKHERGRMVEVAAVVVTARRDPRDLLFSGDREPDDTHQGG